MTNRYNESTACGAVFGSCVALASSRCNSKPAKDRGLSLFHIEDHRVACARTHAHVDLPRNMGATELL
jgi:hypothetical protein